MRFFVGKLFQGSESGLGGKIGKIGLYHANCQRPGTHQILVHNQQGLMSQIFWVWVIGSA